MLRNLWFQLHWLIGITAGLILALVGTTGGILSFEDEILTLMNPGVLSIEAQGAARLSPNLLIEQVQRQLPDKRIASLSRSTLADEPARIQLAPEGKARRGEMRYVNPYTGELLAQPKGQEFFRTVNQLHRNLLIPNWGKQITGICAFCLIFLTLSGLYLRWPRQLANWRVWLTFSFKRTGRGFLWDMHAVLGTWALLLYLLAALTGLYWSYDWYRNFLRELAGEPAQIQQPRPNAGPGAPNPMTTDGPGPQTERPARTAPAEAATADAPPSNERPARARGERNPETAETANTDAAPANERPARTRGERNPAATGSRKAATPVKFDYDDIWFKFEQALNGQAYRSATLRLPQQPGNPLEFNYLDEPAPHERATNRLLMDLDGQVKSHQRYADKPLAKQLLGSMLPLHMGTYFGLPGQILMFIASLGMPVFAVTGWMLYLDRRRKKSARRQAQKAAKASAGLSNSGQVLLAYASQSGTAESLAWQSADRLQQAGLKVQVKTLGQLDPASLDPSIPLLILNATFGDGEAPDNARAFSRHLAKTVALSGLQYGCLSLGDSDYAHYCGFGRQLNAWLQQQGAQPLFEPLEANKLDPVAINGWFEALADLTGQRASVWQQAAFDDWRLSARQLLNPGSQGLGCYHLELEPVSPGASWHAGDIAEIEIPTAEGPVVRDYSIASIPQDGRLELLIRQTCHPDGTLGAGSGWLTATLAVGAPIKLRIRSNGSFHTPDASRPLILIGNGTGLAGLRSHLHARKLSGAIENWLIFGERNRQYDYFYQTELESYRHNGLLARLDLAFSRDQSERVYVQHRLEEAAIELQDWVGRGAAILICGSLHGMGAEVEQTLIRILGDASVQSLIDQQRLLRDLY